MNSTRILPSCGKCAVVSNRHPCYVLPGMGLSPPVGEESTLTRKSNAKSFSNSRLREQLVQASVRLSLPTAREKPPPRRAQRQKERNLSDKDLFEQEMADVIPLSEAREESLPVLASAKTYQTAEDEVREFLEGLVQGTHDFDLSYHEEHLEGAAQDLDPRVLQKLRQGELSWQAYIDLHGLSVDEAKEALHSFVAEQRRKDHQCLLIVHGRGLHSPKKEPILKRRLFVWMTRGFLRKKVLAFCTARPYDGGGGAMYVLLRRASKPGHS
ncbi:MAG: hypothetical protein EP343_26400 [Deltaproteobacteria bacterium]|nr:MAG: hypothetical protein EP343_26400 [Deltaproteobacteria bacterium]